MDFGLLGLELNCRASPWCPQTTTVTGHHPFSAGAAAATLAPFGRHPLLLLVTRRLSSILICSSLDLTSLSLCSGDEQVAAPLLLPLCLQAR
jgi:hypothetical protein